MFLAQICEEEGRFSIADSIASICEKLIRRHPHIFDPDGLPIVASAEVGKASLTPRQVKEQWEEIKAQERKDAGAQDQTVLGGVPRSMPSLLRAYELSSRAAMVGFDWVTTDDVIDKVEEEIRELREAVAAGGGKSPEAEEEFGDLLFALVNVSRKLGIEPEAALRVANDKFQRRFDDVERQVTARGQSFATRRSSSSRNTGKEQRQPRRPRRRNHEAHEGVTTKVSNFFTIPTRRSPQFLQQPEASLRPITPNLLCALVCRHERA